VRSIDRFNGTKLNEVEIAERAHGLRLALGTADKTYVDIIEILEFHVPEFIPGFRLVVRRDIDIDFSAEASFDPPRIVVRETIYDAACEGDQECRRILAHELGHLMLHSNVAGSLQRNYEGYQQEFGEMTSLESTEDQADIFARHFLIPSYIAFSHKKDASKLSAETGTPINIAKSAITISKRQEFYKLRNFNCEQSQILKQ
jgi:hypothetical protein